ncbi:hypothetical protein GCM10011487_69230 [Steroidobacter agaridevorans]|uniref:Lipoprotein n=1 Tax=Steroidobacter agaridevorans TaxID=2695856 RepID=A0A829YQ60_9GAMM|nr:hypothetical protein [Steroidobacter agaridevorans]GFE84923.1 hypothetical protein GCM10011487_69230 [Steroidobacter agaridevorans]
MPIGSLKRCVFAACVALAGCTTPLVDDGTDFIAVTPAPSTTRAEIASAIQDLIKTYPVCYPLRALRLVGQRAANFDPNAGKVRYDDAEADLDVLVRLGYLTKTAFPELGEHVFKYDRTERGQDEDIIGTSGFCLPAERVLVSVTSIEREMDSGRLAVKFTHAADPNSMWVQEPALIKLVGGNRAVLLSGPAEGSARLSRVWIRSEHPLKGAPDSGALWALSWDAVHHRYEGGRWGGVYLRFWEVN